MFLVLVRLIAIKNFNRAINRDQNFSSNCSPIYFTCNHAWNWNYCQIISV